MIRAEFREKRTGFGPAAAVFKRIGGYAAQAAGMFVLARAQLAGGLNPFAPACLAAGMISGFSPAVMMTGCALGSLAAGAGEIDGITLIACSIACALLVSMRLLEKKYEGLKEKRDFLCGLAAGGGLLAPGLAFSGGILYNLLTAALNSGVAMFLAPALVSGMKIRPERRRLMPEEQLSASLLLMICLIGLRAVPHAGRFLSGASAVLITLIFSGAGAGMGAMAGLAAGTALTLGGSDPFMGSVLGLCGLLSGCASGAGRIGAAIAFVLGNTLTVTWGVGYTIGAVAVWPLLAGCTGYCLMPAEAVMRLRGWIRPALPGADAENLALRMRQKAGRRLSGLSEVFGELADGYGEETVLPGEQQIISAVRHALCDGCEGYAACWMGDHAQAGRLMCRMAAEALSGKEITPARDLPPDLIRHCRRSAQIDRRAVPLLSHLAGQRREALKLGAARSLMGRQFREAQKLLDSLSTQMKGGLCVNREYAPLIAAVLDRAGIRAQEITVILDDKLEIVCVLKDKIWDADQANRAAALLSGEMGVPFSPVLSRGQVPGECELRLRQAPALTAAFAAVSCAAEAGEECGDSHLLQMLPDGRLIAALSDGMGQGGDASRESGRCVSLLRKFVSAGIDREAALSAVNSLLMLRGGEEMFATADLCVIDLFSGVAAMSKLGACSSFIANERGVREIAGGRLPLGILDQVEPAAEKTEVYPGDLIIMTSDGIADPMKEGQAEALKREIRRVRRMRPEAAAQALMDWAKDRDPAGRRDDMTVIAIRILARKIRQAG